MNRRPPDRSSFAALLSALVVAVWAVSPPPASAKAPAARGNDTAARRLFERGETYYRMHDFRRAAEAYRKALELRRKPNIIFNLAQCHRKLGELRKALFYYKLFRTDWARQHPKRPLPYAKEIALHIKVLEERILAAKLKQPRTTQVPAPTSKPAAPASTKGFVRLLGVGDGEIQLLIDGVLRFTAPLPPRIALGAGVHQLQLRRPGYRTYRQRIDARPGVERELQVRWQRLAGRNGWWLAAAITSAALAAGAETFALLWVGKANEHYADTQAYKDDRRWVVLGHGLAAGLGAVAIATTFFYIFSGERPSERAATASSWSPLRPLTVSF